MKYLQILDHPRNASKIDLMVSPKSVLEFKTNPWDKNLSEQHFGFVIKILKYFKIFNYLKNVWKTNSNGRPTLVLQCKTRYYLTSFCFSKKP